MRSPMKKTAPAIAWNCKRQSWDVLGVITCEVTGEWSGRVKCWTEIGNPCGNQYSCMKQNGKFYFVLEATE